MQRLSAIVITKDEAANISDCLNSISFCDELIVVDSGSTDGTIQIAQSKGAKTVFHEWCGFGVQKQFALSMATGDWVLSIDADERVTPELERAIKNAILDPNAAGFEIPRVSSFCGKQMRHSGWYPDYVLRLFRREKAQFSAAVVHERVICRGKTKRLCVPILHRPVARLEDALSRMDRYSTASAQSLIAAGYKTSFLTAVYHGVYTFFRTYVLQAGFLDGPEGFLLAVANAEGSYYKYMKAWLSARGRNETEYNP